jgi:hypothetical protein
MFFILTGTHTMVVKVPITPLEEVSYVPYIDRNSYYGGESRHFHHHSMSSCQYKEHNLPLPVEK